MTKFLTTYLLITGIGAFVALAMPSLVIIGLFMLILPGLILGLMPSAFLYGLIFTAAWWVARGAFGDGFIAIAAGIVAVVVVATTATLPTRAKDLAMYRASLLPEVRPQQRVALKGDIRINFLDPRLNEQKKDPSAPFGRPYKAGSSGYQCESFCLSALFTPGVTSITVDKSGLDDQGKPSIEARTYRLVPRPGCSESVPIKFENIHPPLRNISTGGNPNGTFEDGKATVAQWALKLDTEFCLVMEPALRQHDITITEKTTSNRTTRKPWHFGPGSLTTRTVEIMQGDKLVYRSHESRLGTMSKLLFIAATGSLESFHFDWDRAVVSSKKGYDTVSLASSLGEATNLQGRPIAGASSAGAKADLLPQLRARIRAALDNPQATAESPAFQTMEVYFSAVGETASPEDLDILQRLVSDRRLSEYRGMWNLTLPLAQARIVYDAYTRRLIGTGVPAEMQSSYVGRLVDHLGTDSYKLIGPLQKPLLDDRRKRLAIPELVKALGYSDPRNGINLVHILEQHAWAVSDIDHRRNTRAIGSYAEEAERNANLTLIAAAKSGLCLMAPKDPAVLAELESFLHSDSMPRFLADGNAMMDWSVIMVRMGKPIATVEKPSNMSGTLDSYRRQVQSRVQSWRADRC